MKPRGWAQVAVWMFLALQFGWGLLLAFRIPPFDGADEVYHWLRVEQISFGEFFARSLGSNNWGGTIDLRSLKLMGYFGLRYAQNVPLDWRTAHALARQLQLQPSAYAFGSFPSTATFSPLAYLPNAAGVAAARWCGGDLLAQLHAGRIAGVVAYVAMSGLIVWILPAGRLAALALMGMPEAIAQSATLSADPLNLTVPALLAAWCLRLKLRPPSRLSTAARVGMALLTSSLGLLKLTAVIFSCVLLLLPRQIFISTIGRTAFVALCFGASAIVALGWNELYPFIPGVYWGIGADPPATLHELTAHPVQHLGALVRNGLAALHGLTQISYCRIGAHPDLDGRMCPAHVGWLGPCAIVLLSLTERAAQRQPMAACVFAMCAAVWYATLLLAFRVAFEPPLRDGIAGLQGRYLHPAEMLLVLALVMLTPWRGKELYRQGLQACALGSVFAIQAATIVTVVGWLGAMWH